MSVISIRFGVTVSSIVTTGIGCDYELTTEYSIGKYLSLMSGKVDISIETY